MSTKVTKVMFIKINTTKGRILKEKKDTTFCPHKINNPSGVQRHKTIKRELKIFKMNSKMDEESVKRC